jgi:putative ABC transport system permease protein
MSFKLFFPMFSDLRFALRQLTKNPGFSLVAVLTLALSIGSATTSFTALNTLLLRPLPFIQHQERMLYVNEAIPVKEVDSTDICYADFLIWRLRSQTLSALGSMTTAPSSPPGVRQKWIP